MNKWQPDEKGHFGSFGGRYVPETLVPALDELAGVYESVRHDADFHRELEHYLVHYVGRPSPLYYAQRFTEHCGGARIYLKREDLNHTGAHKINNTLGQVLLAKRMGKTRIIAETGAGQHGVATATVCALFGLKCEIYMGEVDVARQELNVFRMRLLGATVHPVSSGTRTLKDAMNEALRDWVTNVRDTFYIIGSAAGPHPYPLMVRDFQAVIGRETRRQILEREARLPDVVIACVGGGSNSLGMFHPFLEDEKVEIIGVEAGGYGLDSRHGATLEKGVAGVLHGSKSLVLQTDDGQIEEAHSISAGLDYPGVGPELAYLQEVGRAKFENVTDDDALRGFRLLSELEGIIPALESSHAIAFVERYAPTRNKNDIIVINLSGRGDKDVQSVAKHIQFKE